MTADANSAPPLRIDIVSDVVCPWCVIGFRQLERAVAQAGAGVVIHWHPFQLNPHIPPGGQNLREHLMAKYGMSAEDEQAMRDRLTVLGAGLGFSFGYTPEMRTYNTFSAHRLLHWAGGLGRQHQLKMALFDAFFARALPVDDAGVLSDAAVQAGLDGVQARAVLDDEARHADDVRASMAFWAGHGIEGVPAMVFDRRHLVSGAQGVEAYTRIIAGLTAQRS